MTSWGGSRVPAGGVTASKAKSRLSSCDCAQLFATVMLFTGHSPYGLTPWCQPGA